MISKYRKEYNENWSSALYEHFLKGVEETYHHKTPFRIAETPFFIPDLLKSRLLEACDSINGVICSPDFKKLTDKAIPDASLVVPNEDEHTIFLQMDFGITLDDKGDPMPKLIEIQGFPSVYFFQEFISRMYRQYFHLPDELRSFFNPAMDSTSYVELLREVIVGNENPAHVVML